MHRPPSYYLCVSWYMYLLHLVVKKVSTDTFVHEQVSSVIVGSSVSEKLWIFWTVACSDVRKLFYFLTVFRFHGNSVLEHSRYRSMAVHTQQFVYLISLLFIFVFVVLVHYISTVGLLWVHSMVM